MVLDSCTTVAIRKPENSFLVLMLANCAIMGKSFNFPFSICKIIGELVDLKLVCIALMLSPAFGLEPFLVVYFSLALITAHSFGKGTARGGRKIRGFGNKQTCV